MKTTVKDILIGAMAAFLLMMLIAAAKPQITSGRYAVAVGGTGGLHSACVTDTITGETFCSGWFRCPEDGDYKEKTWSFTPDWKKHLTD